MSSDGTSSGPFSDAQPGGLPQPADPVAAAQAEQRRQQALEALQVLDSDAEAAFDGLVQAAAAICGTPIALISLIDQERQWFKANMGLEGLSETPRAISFCTHVIEQPDLFVVEDARLDARFASNPLVTGDPHIRFYAGAPLQLASGAAVGTLCVIAREPLQLNPHQRQVLRQLGHTAVHLLEGRRALLAEAELRQEAERINSGMPIGLYAVNAEGSCTFTNARWQEIFGLGLEESLGSGWSDTLHPDDRAGVFTEWMQSVEQEREVQMGFRVLHRDGKVLHVRSQAKTLRDGTGAITGFLGFA